MTRMSEFLGISKAGLWRHVLYLSAALGSFLFRVGARGQSQLSALGGPAGNRSLPVSCMNWMPLCSKQQAQCFTMSFTHFFSCTLFSLSCYIHSENKNSTDPQHWLVFWCFFFFSSSIYYKDSYASISFKICEECLYNNICSKTMATVKNNKYSKLYELM